ncbi:gamma-glutamylcyclotransferase family protein [Natrinema sp. 1APR25-10V2]|uniref:gamma-glutamylcyclotransferase family protein n=1 Tax=Natrinema sp. 1APR25-10V2 TaxID=2951081 RepID=UPI0028759C80|nr:gamma-glutamylcyclotransferase family protein [Natrinema sp. 1APR25-10V2]MDS0475362.1 gamma-glutamylcyclotransferase [Natrinema sp. 1APR25-10V2]
MLVFVYGTLTEPERVATVLGHGPADAAEAFVGRATLEGLHRVEGRYPTLAPAGSVAGRLLAVDEAGLSTLDEYEGVEAGLYARVEVPVEGVFDGFDERCWVYVGDPDRLDADVTWPGDGSFRDRVRRVVSERDAVVRSHE